MTKVHRLTSFVAFLVTTVLVGSACASSGETGSTLPGTPSPTPSQLATPSATLPAASASSSVEPSPATRVTSRVVGGGTYPGYSVAIPAADWSVLDGRFVVRTGGPVIGMSVWDVGQVPKDPCHWRSTLADSGESVADLVAALVAQTSRKATDPKPVTLAGHSGQYLEWSVPSDAVVTGDADFAGCDAQGDHQDFVSWMGNGFGERNQQVAGQVDRLWVLDVNGQRLLVDATYAPDTTAAARDQLARLVESLRFDRP